MSRQQVARIIPQLNELGKEELKTVLAHVTAMLGNAAPVGTSEEHGGGEAEEIYFALAKLLRSTRGFKLPPVRVLKARSKWKAFEEAALIAHRYIGTLERDRAKRIAVTRWCLDLMLHNLVVRRGMYLGMPAYLFGLTNLQGILESYFPGYQQSGLMPRALQVLYTDGTKRKLRDAPNGV